MTRRRSPARSIRVEAMSRSEKYSAVEAPVCPLGKLDVGGEASIGMAGGRWRPTAIVANRKIVAWSEIETSGTRDQRRSRVRQYRTATTSRQIPMTYSVL